MELYHNQSIFKNLGESNMMDQAFEQVLEKNKRNFVSYLFPINDQRLKYYILIWE